LEAHAGSTALRRADRMSAPAVQVTEQGEARPGLARFGFDRDLKQGKP